VTPHGEGSRADAGLTWRRLARAAVVALLLAAALALGAWPALGQLVLTPTLAPLAGGQTGSDFQGGDGNQVDDDAHIDWQGLEQSGRVGHTSDLPQGSDDHFTQGSKENEPGGWVLTGGNLGSPSDDILDTYRSFEHGTGLGTPIFDTADLGPRACVGSEVHCADQPTRTITFRLYGPNDRRCSRHPIFHSTVAVNGGTGPFNSGPFTPTRTGTYRWRAAYSGDANNEKAGPTGCTEEPVVVTPAQPEIATEASGTTVLPNPIHDTATLTGGVRPPARSPSRCSGRARPPVHRPSTRRPSA
jgi:hypothetical protein